eukprot:4710753-Prorocentrum_lima.AAC.1
MVLSIDTNNNLEVIARAGCLELNQAPLSGCVLHVFTALVKGCHLFWFYDAQYFGSQFLRDMLGHE